MAVWTSPDSVPEVETIGGTPYAASTVNGRYVTPKQTAARARIVKAYKDFLGREPSETEIDAQLGGGRAVEERNITHAEGNIRSSEEAAARTAGSGGTPDGTAATTPPPATGPRGAPPPEAYGRYEGFNFDQDEANRDPAKSAKYAFAQFSGGAEVPATKEAAEAWFLAEIKPKMEALGHKINWVKGDKVNFTNQQGTFTIDYVRGAGAPGAAFAWQVDDGGASGAPGSDPTQLGAAAPQSAVAAQQALTGGGSTFDAIYNRLQQELLAQGGGWFTRNPNG